MSDQNPVIARSMSSSRFEPPAPASEKQRRGFAAMNPDQVRELARRGGVAAHRAGTAHEFSSDEARAAGRKGGLAAHSGRKPPEDQPKTHLPTH
jgi:general stress protein YciG